MASNFASRYCSQGCTSQRKDAITPDETNRHSFQWNSSNWVFSPSWFFGSILLISTGKFLFVLLLLYCCIVIFISLLDEWNRTKRLINLEQQRCASSSARIRRAGFYNFYSRLPLSPALSRSSFCLLRKRVFYFSLAAATLLEAANVAYNLIGSTTIDNAVECWELCIFRKERRLSSTLHPWRPVEEQGGVVNRLRSFGLSGGNTFRDVHQVPSRSLSTISGSEGRVEGV